MTNKFNTVIINGEEYIKKNSIKQNKINTDGLKYCIIRTYSAGVFAGYIKQRKGKEGTILKARRLWYWDGAASLSQLAMEGVKKPENCKFPCEVNEVELTEIIEVITCTEEAFNSITKVPIWQI